MGMVQSLFCSLTFCFERVLTWLCCAFLLMLLMFIIILMMVYGITVGYHYAQKELASFAMASRSTTAKPTLLRSGSDDQPVVRLVAVNRTEVEHAPQPILEVYKTKKPSQQLFMDTTVMPIVLLETERPPQKPEMSPREREFAKRLIGRFRRSKNITTTEAPFLRPLRQNTG